ncbi:hypothetical protein, partial [Streptomyces brasiliscabiei]|uniref:hypothetical protein n=1 Tax=Streptomyces brasiliscabiei TaxID=2736302 RepID=UPI0030151BE8
YKADYAQCTSLFSRFRTDASEVDDWSLRSIINPLGEVFNINYESDVIDYPDPIYLFSSTNQTQPIIYDTYTLNFFANNQNL